MKIWSFLPTAQPRFALAVVVLICAGSSISGCASLLPKPVAAPTLYTLEGKATPATALPSDAPAKASATVTLVVNTPRADAGFDSPHMMYVREPYKLEYFVHSEWVDTPARMLLPLVVLTVGKAGAFKAVVPATIAATGELTLDTEIVRLQQDFSAKPSRVVFTVRVYLVDTQSRKTIAWRELEAVVAAPSDDPAGGVVAANRAVQMALQQVADFCVEAEKLWQVTRLNASSLKP